MIDLILGAPSVGKSRIAKYLDPYERKHLIYIYESDRLLTNDRYYYYNDSFCNDMHDAIINNWVILTTNEYKVLLLSTNAELIKKYANTDLVNIHVIVPTPEFYEHLIDTSDNIYEHNLTETLCWSKYNKFNALYVESKTINAENVKFYTPNNYDELTIVQRNIVENAERGLAEVWKCPKCNLWQAKDKFWVNYCRRCHK